MVAHAKSFSRGKILVGENVSRETFIRLAKIWSLFPDKVSKCRQNFEKFLSKKTTLLPAFYKKNHIFESRDSYKRSSHTKNGVVILG